MVWDAGRGSRSVCSTSCRAAWLGGDGAAGWKAVAARTEAIGKCTGDEEHKAGGDTIPVKAKAHARREHPRGAHGLRPAQIGEALLVFDAEHLFLGILGHELPGRVSS